MYRENDQNNKILFSIVKKTKTRGVKNSNPVN